MKTGFSGRQAMELKIQRKNPGSALSFFLKCPHKPVEGKIRLFNHALQ